MGFFRANPMRLQKIILHLFSIYRFAQVTISPVLVRKVIAVFNYAQNMFEVCLPENCFCQKKFTISVPEKHDFARKSVIYLCAQK